MARIQLNDLDVNKELDSREMEGIVGGRRVRRLVGWRTYYRRRRVTRTYYRNIRVRRTRTYYVRYRVRRPVYRWFNV